MREGEKARAEGEKGLEMMGTPGLLARARGSQGVLPSALGGSANTLCASRSRPWPWSVTLSTNLPSTTQFRDLSRPWATPRWCRYLIPWTGWGERPLQPRLPCPVSPAPLFLHLPLPAHLDEVQ